MTPPAFIPPALIKILSDSNELTFEKTAKPKGGGEILYTYRYTKSFSKLGKELTLTKEQITSNLKHNWQ